MNLSRWRQEMPCDRTRGEERRRPRVVIFAADTRPRIEVLDLADAIESVRLAEAVAAGHQGKMSDFAGSDA